MTKEQIEELRETLVLYLGSRSASSEAKYNELCDLALKGLEVPTPEYVESEREKNLKKFAKRIFDKVDWPECLGDIDGADFQEIAVACGLLTPTTIHAPCSTDEDDPCQCRDYYDPDEFTKGVTCYRKADFLLDSSSISGESK